MVDLRKLEKDRPEDRGFKNPPLAKLNEASRQADAANRHEAEEAANAAKEAVSAALFRNPARRMQKNLRPVGDKF